MMVTNKPHHLDFVGKATCPCCDGDKEQHFHVRVYCLRPELLDRKAVLATFKQHWEEMFDAKIEDDGERLKHLVATLRAYYPEVGFHANNQ